MSNEPGVVRPRERAQRLRSCNEKYSAREMGACGLGDGRPAGMDDGFCAGNDGAKQHPVEHRTSGKFNPAEFGS
jgi:hypothetical protein